MEIVAVVKKPVRLYFSSYFLEKKTKQSSLCTLYNAVIGI